MGYHYIFARQQLVDATKDLVEELSKIKSTKEDDHLDEEYKRGIRTGLEFATEIIFQRVEKLKNEQK